MTYWFKPKRYGYGAAPANWRGWLATVGFIVIAYAFLAGIVAYRSELTVETVIVWAVAFVALELAFIWIAWKKTDGVWRWRWGSKDIGK
jgi:hypothetical protein